MNAIDPAHLLLELPHRLLGVQQAALLAALRLAKQDPFLATSKAEELRGGETRQVILYHSEVVGFFSPRQQSYEGKPHWRAGALFLLPAWRKQGIMNWVLRDFFHKHPRGLVWIDDKNTASLRLFTGLGFERAQFRKGIDGEPGHWYVLRPRAQSLEALPAYTHW